MFRVLLAILTGLVAAAVLHVVIVLAIPHFSNRDAYTRAVAQGKPHQFHVLQETTEKQTLASGDPFMRVAVCTFDIGEKPVRLSALGAVPFWSVAVYDKASNEVFSMNDRTSAGGVMDILVADAVQIAAIRKAQPASLSQAILTESDQTEGYVVLRTMVPQPSFGEEAERFLNEAKCQPTPWR